VGVVIQGERPDPVPTQNQAWPLRRWGHWGKVIYRGNRGGGEKGGGVGEGKGRGVGMIGGSLGGEKGGGGCGF